MIFEALYDLDPNYFSVLMCWGFFALLIHPCHPDLCCRRLACDHAKGINRSSIPWLPGRFGQCGALARGRRVGEKRAGYLLPWPCPCQVHIVPRPLGPIGTLSSTLSYIYSDSPSVFGHLSLLVWYFLKTKCK